MYRLFDVDVMGEVDLLLGRLIYAELLAELATQPLVIILLLLGELARGSRLFMAMADLMFVAMMEELLEVIAELLEVLLVVRTVVLELLEREVNLAVPRDIRQQTVKLAVRLVIVVLPCHVAAIGMRGRRRRLFGGSLVALEEPLESELPLGIRPFLTRTVPIITMGVGHGGYLSRARADCSHIPDKQRLLTLCQMKLMGLMSVR